MSFYEFLPDLYFAFMFMDNAYRRVSLQVDNVFILIDSRLRLHSQISELLMVSTNIACHAYCEKYIKVFFDEFVLALAPSTTPLHTNA